MYSKSFSAALKWATINSTVPYTCKRGHAVGLFKRGAIFQNHFIEHKIFVGQGIALLNKILNISLCNMKWIVYL